MKTVKKIMGRNKKDFMGESNKKNLSNGKKLEEAPEGD